MESFRKAMEDDLDNAGALAVLFDVIRDGNRRLDAGEDAGPWVAAYDEFIGVLGLAEPGVALDDVADALAGLAGDLGISDVSGEEAIAALVEERSSARADKDWAKADQIRDGLTSLGIVLEDTPDGVRWHRG